ncbi:kinase-like domain-containing protein, partial [Gamsiella multidivaricata]|uniref:kinase-like domain-containing protein n=1 Tax=Gamsiella multidivaricata TaxID=101098 RepID=UPI00221E5189
MAVKSIQIEAAHNTDIERETKIVSQLAHRHIIQGYGVEQDGNYVYIITDYAEGGNLMGATPKLDWDSKRRIVTEVARGLAYLHNQDILHRDIKGDNILLTKHNEVKLCDFGLAKIIASATRSSTYTQKGTPKWMAPELKVVKPEYSTKSDIYTLDVVMEDMVNGDAPL